MPRKVAKRPAEGDGGSSKRQNLEFDDWRSPLYYWHGQVSTDDHSGKTTWEGTWIASKDGLPTPSEFGKSPNSFKLVSTDFLSRDGVALEESCPFGRSGRFTGTFKLDNDGTGLRDYSDLEHRIVFKNRTDGTLLVGARGAASFGQFVSTGCLTYGTRNAPASLTLARRYITEDDPRAAMSAWQALLSTETTLAQGRREAWDSPWVTLQSSSPVTAAATMAG